MAEERVYIFDTTLRDGEQSNGGAMTFEQKLLVASMLDGMRVDIIEAGYPFASPDDYRAVSEIARRAQFSVICGLARALPEDIDRCAEAVRHAGRGRIHTFIATSPGQMKNKLGMAPAQVYEEVIASVTRARNLIDDVEWSAEDATRSQEDFLCRCVEAAIRAGASTINIPDTVGYAVPEQYAELIRSLRERVPNSDKARFSVHCHDDLGNANANSLAGIMAGARQVECTINGVGERAGNAAMEEVVMNIRTRDDYYAFTVGVDATQFVPLSKLVSSLMYPVAHNKAVVGRNAFAHASGIHQAGMLKDRDTYEIMEPQSVGWKGSELPLTKHSGRAGLEHRLQALGYHLGPNELFDVFGRFKSLADRKKEVRDDDLIALVDENASRAHERISLASLRLTMNDELSEATIALRIDGALTCPRTTRAQGPVDAVFSAIRSLVPHEATLSLYEVAGVTRGSDAQAGVTVELQGEDGRVFKGHSADPNTLRASAIAYLGALNRLLFAAERVPNPTL